MYVLKVCGLVALGFGLMVMGIFTGIIAGALPDTLLGAGAVGLIASGFGLVLVAMDLLARHATR